MIFDNKDSKLPQKGYSHISNVSINIILHKCSHLHTHLRMNWQIIIFAVYCLFSNTNSASYSYTSYTLDFKPTSSSFFSTLLRKWKYICNKSKHIFLEENVDLHIACSFDSYNRKHFHILYFTNCICPCACKMSCPTAFIVQ